MAQEKTAKVTFDKAAHGGMVRGAVNGARFEFPVGQEVEVTEAQLSALSGSGATFTINSPLAGEGAGEGSSASSTLVLPGTAFGDGAANFGRDKDGNFLPTPEIRQITDKELARDRVDQESSKDQAETTEGAPATGGAGSQGATGEHAATSPRDGSGGQGDPETTPPAPPKTATRGAGKK